ncbi:MAG: hypothetical protein ABFS45_16180 [Pseudomonadota bacterium]
MDSFLSIAGSIASIAGAIWAFMQAKSAANSAKQAKRIRDELVQRREIVEVSRVHTEVTRILKVVSQVGPSCTNASTRGIKNENIAREGEEFSRFINEHSRHFSELFDNKAKSLCESLAPLIEGLSEAKDFEKTKRAGKQIYYLINSFMPDVKSLADERRENVQIT